jgi:hypothetical protein
VSPDTLPLPVAFALDLNEEIRLLTLDRDAAVAEAACPMP